MDESECSIINGGEEIGDEFYEKIEAPKFVDLTAPDLYQPGDDRSWFCLRVGCDQKHEEEMDSEAIYKNFVLRVMAARSPNIRLRRALCKKNSGLDPKCPRTVPAKPSKSRITRMALISSISKRIVDTKVKVKPLSKQNATPKVKARRASITAKALTTPRSKKQLANPEAFRSVRNQKTTATEASNSRLVAKTLVFDSPKKGVRTKNPVEMNTPLKDLCAGMTKLEITSGKKQVLGYSRPLPSDTSRKQFRVREVKSRVFDGLLTQNGKVQQAKSSKCLDKDIKASNLQKNHDHVCPETVENDVNETEIQEKTSNTSQGVCSIASSGDENIPGENLTATEMSRPPSDENSVDAPPDASRIDSKSLSNCGDDSVSELEPPSEIMERDVEGNESEAMESDDKENALACDDNRELDVETIHIEHKILGKHEIPKNNQKTTIPKSKQSRESSTPASNGAQSLKLKKPKPTNPKPFRLRTDERGILKEANSEKKLCPTKKPLCEIAAVPKLERVGGNSFAKHHYPLLRDAKCNEQNENHEDSQTERQRQDQQPQNQTFRMKIAKERMGRKATSTPQRHTISSKQKLVASQQKSSHDKSSTPKSENSLTKRTKTPSLLRTGQLRTIKETSPTIIKATTVIKARENGASSLAARRSKTIPKEPNFHTMHRPKDCTRRRVAA